MTAPADEVNDLVRSFRPMAAGVARAFRTYIPPGITADDVEAACLEAVWEAHLKRDRKRTECEFHVWARGFCYRAARDLCGRGWRRHRRAPAAGDAIEAVAERLADAEPITWPVERWQEVLAVLDPLARAVTVRHLIRGESLELVAPGLGISAARAALIWSNALATIRAHAPGLEKELSA